MSDFRPYLDRRVLLHLDDGLEIDGKLVRESDSALVLDSPTVRAGDSAEVATGTVLVDRLRINWTQVP